MTFDGIYKTVDTTEHNAVCVTINLTPFELTRMLGAMEALQVSRLRWKPTFNCATFVSVCLLNEQIHSPDKLWEVLTELTEPQ